MYYLKLTEESHLYSKAYCEVIKIQENVLSLSVDLEFSEMIIFCLAANLTLQIT